MNEEVVIDYLDYLKLNQIPITPWVTKVTVRTWGMENLEGLKAVISRFPQLEILIVEDSSKLEYVNFRDIDGIGNKLIVFKNSRIETAIGRTDEIESQFKKLKEDEVEEAINKFNGDYSAIVIYGSERVVKLSDSELGVTFI